MSVAAAVQALERGELDQAASAAEAVLAQLRDAGVARGAAEAARTLVAAKASVGRLEEANGVVSDMVRRFKDDTDKASYAESLLAEAELYSGKGQNDKALKSLKAMPEVATLGAAGRELEPHYLKLLVNVQLAKEAPAQAKSAAQDMLALAQSQGDKVAQAAAWSSLAMAGALQARDEDGSMTTGEEAMQAADKALTLYQESGNKQGQASALLAAARARMAINRPSEGLTKAQDAMELSRTLGQTKGIVSALELIIQSHSMSGYPNAGLRAANEELSSAQKSGNKKAEAELLDMLAHTHATLREPVSAMQYARQALNLHYASGDRSAQGWSLHTIAEMQRARGEMQEAIATVKESQASFQAAGDKLGVEQALWTLSLIMATLGQLEKAPGRKQVKQALRRFTRAVQDRKVEDFKEAEEELNNSRELLIEGELYEYIQPLVQVDDGAKTFLKEQGWNLDGSSSETVARYEGTHIKQFPHKAFYLQTIMTGMNFGPQFRAVHPYRQDRKEGHVIGDMECQFEECSMSASQLAETEDWQQQTQYRHGIMDSGLQVGSIMMFP